MKDTWKEDLKSNLSGVIRNAMSSALSIEKSDSRVSKVRLKYKGLPRRDLAGVMTKYACRKTSIEGGINSLGITAVEAAAPQTGGLALPAAVAGSAALLAADVAWTTTVQAELVADIANTYGSPLKVEDEDDVWEVFTIALGIASVEEVGKVGAQLGQDLATKQFRKWLQTGVRDKAQKWVRKKAGERAAKLLAEKYLLRLIPLANVGISAVMNHHFTASVGASAKRLFAFRSCLFRQVDDLPRDASEARVLLISTVFWVASKANLRTYEFLALYARTVSRLGLNAEEEAAASELNEQDQIGGLIESLAQVSCPKERRILMDVSLTTAALALSSHSPGVIKRLWSGREVKERARTVKDCLQAIASALRVDLNPDDLNNRMELLRRG